MQEKEFSFQYQVYNEIDELPEEDVSLLTLAREVAAKAYAPYSKFYVGAVARLANGELVAGTNQENASYPVGICAERTLLGNAAMSFPAIPILAMAISYFSPDLKSNYPISPCGLCRQSLLEYQQRVAHPIRLILAGQLGPVYLIQTANDLLPFAFSELDTGWE